MKRGVFSRLLLMVTVFLLSWASPESSARDKPPAAVEPRKPLRILVPKLSRHEEPIVARLRELKFEVTVQPWNKVDPDKLKEVDVIFLPTAWGTDVAALLYFDEIDDAFHRFVKRGGGLLVCQPNPAPLNTITPKLLPYPITFQNSYDDSEPARLNLDPAHYITEDLPGEAMPFPYDPMLKVDERYKILA